MTSDHLYQWKVMPFGVSSAPTAYSQLIHLTLNGIIDDHLAVYLDDICIFTEDMEPHLTKLEQVFERLRYEGLQLKPSKAKIMFQEIRVLGYQATKEGIMPTDEHISGLTKMVLPELESNYNVY